MTQPKKYTKPKDLVERLKVRGMIFGDEDVALHRLEKIGYYRLAAYWHPFRRDVAINRTEGDGFIDGTFFDVCHEFYVFDKDLRSFLSDPLERIEIALRARVSDVIGSRDPIGHRNPALLGWQREASISHQNWLKKQDRNFAKSSADFAIHFRSKYSGHHPPIWIAKETWDWGTMSHLLNALRGSLANEVAEYFGFRSGPHIGSWAKSLNTLRNDCAHHSRVWNRGYSLQPLLPSRGSISELNHLHNPTHRPLRLYPLAAILIHLCKQAYLGTTLGSRMRQLILGGSPKHQIIDARRTGFPDNWHGLELWH